MPGATTENLGGSALTGLVTAPAAARSTARTQDFILGALA
jgi:hypothetical protein